MLLKVIRLLIFFVPFVKGQAQSAISAPKYDALRQAYTSSVDPGTSQGYPNSGPRAGAFWSLNSNNNAYPANTPSNGSPTRSPAPTAVPFNSNATTLFSVPGVAASPDVTSGGNPSDTAIRFDGNDNNCLQVPNLASTDSCLFDPTTCSISTNDGKVGFSLSFWVNLPNGFDTGRHYVLDTGGRESGQKGVSIYFTNSPDGNSFNHQLNIIVSIGNSFWKTVINGLVKPYQWNNIGVRWSPGNSPIDNNPLGLQVFINKSSVAWKRLSIPSTDNSGGNNNTVLSSMTIGCDNGGYRAMEGRLDNLAIWDWRLTDDNKDGKPTDGNNLKELEYFDGDLQFSSNPPYCYGSTSCLPGAYGGPTSTVASSGSSDPYEQPPPYTEDTSLAVEGNCLIGDPSTWNGLHPIDCADTRREMQAAIEYRSDFNATQYLNALTRVVQKAGPNGLSRDNLGYLLNVTFHYGLSRLDQDLASSAISHTVNWLETYMNFVYVTSALTNSSIYGSLWEEIEMNENGPGITSWIAVARKWQMKVAAHLPDDNELALRSANNTAVAAFRISPDITPTPFVYPDYRNDTSTGYSNQQMFWITRNTTWNIRNTVGDFMVIPAVGLASLTDGNSTLTALFNLFNTYGDNMPAYLDSRVKGQGIGSTQFSVNSRVISFFANNEEGTLLQSGSEKTAVAIAFEHSTPQDERPFMKAATLCVVWRFNQNKTKIGAWDTGSCQLVATNDTHSACLCTSFGDFAILRETTTTRGINGNAYYICYALYIISIICLLVYIVTIVATRHIHYEIYFITMNIAASMMFALIFYSSTWTGYGNPMTCIVVSVFMQYFYLSAYLWMVLGGHYVFRAVTGGKLGKIFFYFYIGYGVPAIVVVSCLGVNVLMYGAGMRCLGNQYKHFMEVYIGEFIFFIVLAMPFLLIALCNIMKHAVIDREDWSDIKHGMFGLLALCPLTLIVWIMAIMVYMTVQSSAAFDFFFDFFNSLQGIFIFVFLGVTIPSYRRWVFCKNRKFQYIPTEEKKQVKFTIPYLT